MQKNKIPYSKIQKVKAIPFSKRCIKAFKLKWQEILEGLAKSKLGQLWRKFSKASNKFFTEYHEKILFLLSTFLGTILFFIVFELLYVVNSYNLENSDNAFTLSYTGAYFISVIWQHALNRYLVFKEMEKNVPYCFSLMQAYVIYSCSLISVSLLGLILFRFITNHHIVACITLPASGIFNYYSFNYCFKHSNR